MIIPKHIYLSLIAALTVPIALPQINTPAPVPARIVVESHLSLSQVVQNLVQNNATRAKALENYGVKRIYRLEYKGFPKDIRAEMIVEMTYNAPDRKEFTILSESGSKWIVKRVFKRLIEAEREAQGAASRTSVELNSRNYEFTSLENESNAGGCRYVLGIRPKSENKFLYRGRIWVDDQDFAVCRIEAEPARNPSIWITATQIHHNYQKFDDFWLPVENQSVSNLRLGGRATLTITYQSYEINRGPALNDKSVSMGQ